MHACCNSFTGIEAEAQRQADLCDHARAGGLDLLQLLAHGLAERGKIAHAVRICQTAAVEHVNLLQIVP